LYRTFKANVCYFLKEIKNLLKFQEICSFSFRNIWLLLECFLA